MEYLSKSVQSLSLFFIRCYRYWISPFWGYCCRFYPSCSEYALISLERYGLLYGGWLTLCRLCRCHPWGNCGYDPVPIKLNRK